MNTTPEALRNEAADSDRAAAESFDRCDTDGFLSQWAHGLDAQRKRAEAELLENGGTVEVHVLTDLEGHVVSTDQGFSRYGEWWRLDDSAARVYGKAFYSPSKAQTPGRARATDRAKGFTFALVRVAGLVKMAGSGRGLAGATSVRVVTVADWQALKDRKFEIIAQDVDRAV